ncbi:MAG TPA: carboxypeptidase-like regulatory domain-containing protein [Pelobium sp.]|nr:carboxypeptidase-like regulatory domain-containing protein [Pelobium sp.]
MNNPQQDIVLIRKYHNGELSPAEKNQLEARALDDPFLQDALDGYEDLGVKEDDILTLVKKLDERTEPGKVIAPIWGIKQWGIAASVLLCIALGSIYFNQTPKDRTIALKDIQKREDIPQAEKSKILPLESIAVEKLTITPKTDKPTETANNSAPLNKTESYTPEPDIIVEPLAAVPETKNLSKELEEVSVIGYPTQKKQDITGAVSSMNSESLMASKMMRTENSSQTIKLKGKIIDEKDSTALPGVTVKNLENGIIKQTDANGEFTIEANKNDDLAISFLGYETKNKTIQITDDSMLIALAPSTASLSEVVVVGYGAAKRETNLTTGPKVGWRRFKQYVEEQAEIAKIGNGKVHIQFIINPDGELSDFKIIDSFSPKAGVAAINIIKNYNSGWIGSAEKIPHKTNITIQFK